MTFKFSSTRDPRDVEAPEGSINAQLLALPQQRQHTHDMRGRLLRLPRSGLIVVPIRYHVGYYSCVVVDGTEGPRRDDGTELYPRGGHDIDVSALEMQTAIELTVTKPPLDMADVVSTIAHLAANVDELDDTQRARAAAAATRVLNALNPDGVPAG